MKLTKKQIKKIANEILEATEKNMKLAVEEKKQIKEKSLTVFLKK